MNTYLRLNRLIWRHLPPPLKDLAAIRLYGSFLHGLVRLKSERGQAFTTSFFRNRPQLQLISRLADKKATGSTLRMAILGCSNGAEVYSILWTIRSRRPDLKVISHAVDISKDILESAQTGVYSAKPPELVGTSISARINREEMQDMFDIDRDRDEVTIKPWIKEGIIWHLGDARSSDLLDVLGPQDMVVANNFLCHMASPNADRCLRNIARLVNAGGYLFITGIDLDIRTKVALDLGWMPVPDLREDIHDGDPSLRNNWPLEYWGLEPFNKERRGWEVRYASVFQLGAHH